MVHLTSGGLCPPLLVFALLLGPEVILLSFLSVFFILDFWFLTYSEPNFYSASFPPLMLNAILKAHVPEKSSMPGKHVRMMECIGLSN